jgi:predicted transposase/invertase (TIGR01784 family)
MVRFNVAQFEVLHREVYGEYNEFEEEGMDFSSLRVIEKLHKEMEDVRRSREEERRFREEAVFRAAELEQSREEAVSKAAELAQSREEAVSRAELDRQRLRDTARNILRLGLSVEQVTQATGLPRETVQTLAAQL